MSILSFTRKEKILLRKLNTPAKVQDFLNRLKFNFEKDGETLKSPVQVLRTGSAHCMEAALLGAYILSLHGYPPLVLHLEATEEDFDHVVAPFRQYGRFGALSKTNHAVLRYREPVYKSIRELVMSYFHEYFSNRNGRKTLRKYSKPLNLNAFDKDWISRGNNLWDVDRKLNSTRHYTIAPKSALKNLRKADKVEIQAGTITESRTA